MNYKDLAAKIEAYIIEQRIQPDHTAVSDAEGISSFDALSTGLYLVLGSTAENNTGIYTFEDFLIYLPTPKEDGSFAYDLDAYPKPSKFIPKTEYTVKILIFF